jgi:5-methylcytosine-specific restriction endonuclease McrA
MAATNLKSVSNESLVFHTKKLCSEERRLTTLVLEYLREIDLRKIHLELGYSSLYEFCKTELHYSEGSAHRRISAMRLMSEVPEIKPMIESGAVSLSGIASVQSFCNNQKKQEKPVPAEEKRKLVEGIQHKTTRQVESMLLTLDPYVIKKDRERMVTPDLTEVKVTLDQNTMKMIEELKGWLSHSMPFASTKDILVIALKELAKQKNPTRIAGLHQQRAKQPSVEAQMPKPKSYPKPITIQKASSARYIPTQTKKLVWNKFQGKCCYRNSATGKVCGSQKFVQFDHKFPFSRGGRHDLSNLQLLCGAHNRMKGAEIDHKFG